VQTALGKRRSAWDDIPIVLGDATEPESLHAIAEDTRVVCTTVGPYTTYGTPLVEACIAAETDYCDLTGEVNWVREMIDRYHDDAVEAGTRIVHSCGFDSIPSDLGTKLVQSFAIDEFGTPCDMAHIYLEDSRGSVSGGTMASAIEVFRAASTDPLAQQTLRNPYSLAPKGERDGVDPGAQSGPKKDLLRSVWTAPSPMAMMNERVVRRSNALLGYPWGREFECTEVLPWATGSAAWHVQPLSGRGSRSLLLGWRSDRHEKDSVDSCSRSRARGRRESRSKTGISPSAYSAVGPPLTARSSWRVRLAPIGIRGMARPRECSAKLRCVWYATKPTHRSRVGFSRQRQVSVTHLLTGFGRRDWM